MPARATSRVGRDPEQPADGIEVSGERNARAYLQAHPEVRAVLVTRAPRSGPRYQTEVLLCGRPSLLAFTPHPDLGWPRRRRAP